ncbi:MAG: hypothetical protein IJO19_05300 [Clostridia bacterium]|nr:hypothetical protein [Clostridia bacterium]
MIELIVLFLVEIGALAVIISVIVGVGAIAFLILRKYFRSQDKKNRRIKINIDFKQEMRVLREPQIYKEVVE